MRSLITSNIKEGENNNLIAMLICIFIIGIPLIILLLKVFNYY